MLTLSWIKTKILKLSPLAYSSLSPPPPSFFAIMFGSVYKNAKHCLLASKNVIYCITCHTILFKRSVTLKNVGPLFLVSSIEVVQFLQNASAYDRDIQNIPKYFINNIHTQYLWSQTGFLGTFDFESIIGNSVPKLY